MNRYTINSFIGEGSFGRVYKANRKADNKIVAIKIISKRGRWNKEMKDLRRECDIQGKLKHPNIIEMFESFETKNDLVVVTEFALVDLHRYLAKNGAIAEDKAQTLISHLVSALYYLHSKRILHRDLKPQNVLLNEELHAKLCDFGLARSMTMGTHVLTSIKGTPLYMAPELLAERPYDHQADLWSLGCIAYESMNGQPPFYTTSILHLIKLIKHEDVKWPSFLSSDCCSFLQGLLEKDPSLRITWAQILCHPFVEGKLLISGIAPENSPFTNPKKATKTTKHKKHEEKNRENQSGDSSAPITLEAIECGVSDLNLASSQDSINAIIQSDTENPDTDVGEDSCSFSFSEETPPLQPFATDGFEPPVSNVPGTETNSAATQPYFIAGSRNMIVNHLNDNTKLKQSTGEAAKLKINSSEKHTMKNFPKRGNSSNKDLEKRKLSQNLNNFSLRLGTGSDEEHNRRTVEKKKNRSVKNNAQHVVTEEKPNENTPPCLLPGWDSCDESQSPAIENEEWLAFLHRSIQEILDGELDSLKQQNLVSIIVAPLRNTNATPKVVDSVAQLLSLPLVLNGPCCAIDQIKAVFIEVKLVPNLLYASKLLVRNQELNNSSSGLESKYSLRSVLDLTEDELSALSRLYELICHLVHLKEQFLLQFCDAMVILSINELLINFLNHDFTNSSAVRITNCVIASLCCVLRELPENANLVEQVVFNSKLDLTALLSHKNELLKIRLCMLLRLLGRFSLHGLKNVWSTEMRDIIESLADDSSEDVREEATPMLEELRNFSFYSSV